MTDQRDHLLSNQPPPMETAVMELTTALAELDARKAEILAAFTPERLVVTDNATAGSTADKIKIAEAFLERVDRLRRDHKDPYDQAVKAVDGKVHGYLQEVRDAIGEGWKLIRAFRADARARAARQLEEQRAEEARLREELMESPGPFSEPEPPAPAPVRPEEIRLPVARGDYGAKVSDQLQKTFTIDDPRKLPDQILNAPAVRKAMLAAIKQLVRLQETIEGVTIGTEAGDKIRRAG